MHLSDDELRELYSGKYFEGDEYLDYAKEKDALEKNFRRRLSDLRRRHRRGERLWEIGSAYGFFLETAKKTFRVAGCDISGHAVQYAREKLHLNVREGNYLDLPAPKKPYDIVCLWDTVEHLREPHLYIEKAYKELRPGGTLALSTGDIGSLNARWKKDKWRLIHPPSHLHYFSSQSMDTLLRRLGFGRVEFSYPAFWRSADAVAYRLLAWPEGKPTAPVYTALHKAGALSFTFPLNTWDLMTVHAVK
jgi:SAM-dependent methyltransferase